MEYFSHPYYLVDKIWLYVYNNCIIQCHMHKNVCKQGILSYWVSTFHVQCVNFTQIALPFN